MDLVLIVLQLPFAFMILYLDVLTVAAVVGRRTRATGLPHSRFAFLIPAHNEEKQLPRLLHSISAVDYPNNLYDVHVVADNCVDRTAAVAAAAGTIVHERRNEQLKGKGYALQWLLDSIRRFTPRYDAYIIVDADSVVSANLLAVLNSHLARGDQAIQCYDGVLNHDESWYSTLSYVALALFNNLRPRGLDTLGLSVGLRGNGMCFTSAVIERFGWEAFGLNEDHVFHRQLVSAGINVRYAAEASVLAEQPTSLRQAHTQSVRWERGRFQMTPLHLLSQGIRHRNPTVLAILTEYFMPPLSLLTGTVFLLFLITASLHTLWPFLLASTLVVGEIVYVVIGLRLVGARARIYLALLKAPFYVVWKVWIVAIAAAQSRDRQWVRTARSQEDA